MPKRVRDLGLRAAGLVCLLAAAAAGRLVLAIVRTGPPHPGSPAEMALAAAAFLCASGGAVLLLLGAHVFDQVAISPRWARQRQPDHRCRQAGLQRRVDAEAPIALDRGTPCRRSR